MVMRYLSLFSGIGGFELGIERAYELHKLGTESKDSTDTKGRTPQYSERPLCVGFSEIDRYAIQIYQRHFPGHKNYGDITKIRTEDLPEFDLLVGGFPCQAFSIAGKRGGFADTRGTLFFEIARILRAKQPRLFLLENVKGLLSHDDGRTFRVIISTLDELGYDLQWQVLNSKNHGVPQNRERVLIVGHLRGTRRPEVFPFGEGSKDSSFTAREKTSVPPVTTQGGRNLRGAFIAAERGRYNSEGKTEQRLEPRFDGLSNTLTGVEKDNRLFDGTTVRRLTPTECERLQGFPDGWTEGVSDTQRYKTLGNAVTVNVIEEIIKRLFPDLLTTKE